MKTIFHRSILRAVIVIILYHFGAAAIAQVVKVDTTSNWRKAFRAGFNLNQASFSGNWKAGGVNSLGFNGLLNFKANYKKEKTSWDNEIDLLYGMVNNQGQGYRKTLDRVFIDTKYGHALSGKWDLFLALNMQTQFAKGFKYTKDATGLEVEQLISDSFAPAFITASLGLEFHPVEYFKVRFSPLAPRLTILRNNDGRYNAVDSLRPYGVEVGSDIRYEWYAFQMLAEFNKEIAENINLKWRYILFANYQELEWKQVDHRLDLNIVGKVNRYINVSLGGIFLYDYDQDAGPQYNEALSLGFLYTFQNFEEKK